jgi:hypothetical protein
MLLRLSADGEPSATPPFVLLEASCDIILRAVVPVDP